MSWKVVAVSNAVIAVAYLAVAWAVLIPLIRTGQLRSNLLGAATGAVFLTGAVHHGLEAGSLLSPEGSVRALRAASDWRSVAVDLAAVAAALTYWMARSFHGSFLHGAKLFDDIEEKQQQALEINDSIVQGLTVAQMALELDEREQSREALERTLVSARRIITELLGDTQSDGARARMVRRTAAIV